MGAQQTTGKISGQVTATDGSGLAGATCKLMEHQWVQQQMLKVVTLY